MKLVVDDIEVNVGIGFQRDLISCIPNLPMYKELLHILSQSKDAGIRCSIAYSDNISQETALILLEDKDASVIDAILINEVAKPLITLDQIKKVIENPGSERIETIIDEIYDYTLIEPSDIIRVIFNLNDPYLNLLLANCEETSNRILKKLAKSDDPEIQSYAKKRLDG